MPSKTKSSGPAESTVVTPKLNLHKVSLLIVDSNMFSRSFTRGLCRDLGFNNIFSTGNTMEAMKLLLDNPIDIIICDWDMTPLSGTEFVRQIRASKELPNSNIPIIMFSSVGDLKAIVGARDIGVNDVLTRPFVMKRFITSLTTALSNPRPYVKSETYTGPCRRHKQEVPPGGIERRAGPNQGKPYKPPEEVAEMIHEPGGMSMEEMEKAYEAVVAKEAENYDKVRKADLDALFELAKQLKGPDASLKTVVDKIHQKSKDLKAMGTTFGFPLLTVVSGLLCDFIQDVGGAEHFKTLPMLQIVESHIMVMKTIVDFNLHDTSDQLTSDLITELHTVVEKFKKGTLSQSA